MAQHTAPSLSALPGDALQVVFGSAQPEDGARLACCARFLLSAESQVSHTLTHTRTHVHTRAHTRTQHTPTTAVPPFFPSLSLFSDQPVHSLYSL